MYKVICVIATTSLLVACASNYHPTIEGPTATLKTFYQGIIFTDQGNCSKGRYFNYAGSIFHPELIDIPANRVNTFLFTGTPPYGNTICQMAVEFYADAGEHYTPLFQLPTSTNNSGSHGPCTMTILNTNNQSIAYHIRQLKAFRWGHLSPNCYPEPHNKG